MSEQPVLYIGEKNVSSWSMRAWVALTYKGIPFEERTISLPADKDRAQRRKVSPTGKVPVLHHDGLVIPDSLAIIEYLEEVFPPPTYPPLWPRDRAERATSRWLAAAMHSGFSNVREGMSFNLCFLPQVPHSTTAAMAEAREVLALWEWALARPEHPVGPFLCGTFSGADVLFATMAVRLRAFRVPTGDFPLAAHYMDVVLDAPPVRAWLDEARTLKPVANY